MTMVVSLWFGFQIILGSFMIVLSFIWTLDFLNLSWFLTRLRYCSYEVKIVILIDGNLITNQLLNAN